MPLLHLVPKEFDKMPKAILRLLLSIDLRSTLELRRRFAMLQLMDSPMDLLYTLVERGTS